jgi:hypothetical protein
MKIEFIKETRPDNDTTVYYTKANGYFVSNSLSLKEDEARKWFELIKKNGIKALEPKQEVIESFEIEVNEEK